MKSADKPTIFLLDLEVLNEAKWTWAQKRYNRVCFKFSQPQRKIKEINSNLKVQIKTLSYVNMTQLNPFLDPQSQPDTLEPKNWGQNWVEHKKSVGFGRTNVPDLV